MLVIAQFILYVLKLTHTVDWSWWVINIPAELIGASMVLKLLAFIYLEVYYALNPNAKLSHLLRAYGDALVKQSRGAD